MIKTNSWFSDWTGASGAVDALVASSFPVEDVRLFAELPNGSRPEVPIRVQSHLLHGFALGGVLGVVVGVAGAFWAGVEGALSFGALAGASIGCVAGGAIGLGSWRARASRRGVPRDADGFVVVVRVSSGRLAAADAILAAAGGREAQVRTVKA